MELAHVIAAIDKEIAVLSAVNKDIETYFLRTSRVAIEKQDAADEIQQSVTPKEDELVIASIEKALQKAAETWDEASKLSSNKKPEAKNEAIKMPPESSAKTSIGVKASEKVAVHEKKTIIKPQVPAQAHRLVNSTASESGALKPKRYVPAHQKAPFKTFTEPIRGSHKVTVARKKVQDSVSVPAPVQNSLPISQNHADAKLLNKPKSAVEPTSIPKQTTSSITSPSSESASRESTPVLSSAATSREGSVVTPRSRMRSWLSERELSKPSHSKTKTQTERDVGETNLKTASKRESTSETNLKRTAEGDLQSAATDELQTASVGHGSSLPLRIERGEFVNEFLRSHSRAEQRLLRAEDALLEARKSCCDPAMFDDAVRASTSKAKAKFLARLESRLRPTSEDSLKRNGAKKVIDAAAMRQEFDQLSTLLSFVRRDIDYSQKRGEATHSDPFGADFRDLAFSRRLIEHVLQRAVQLERPYQDLLSRTENRRKASSQHISKLAADKSSARRPSSRIIVYGSARSLARLNELRFAVLTARLRLHIIDTYARSLVDAFRNNLSKSDQNQAALFPTYRALVRLILDQSAVVVLDRPV